MTKVTLVASLKYWRNTCIRIGTIWNWVVYTRVVSLIYIIRQLHSWIIKTPANCNENKKLQTLIFTLIYTFSLHVSLGCVDKRRNSIFWVYGLWGLIMYCVLFTRMMPTYGVKAKAELMRLAFHSRTSFRWF